MIQYDLAFFPGDIHIASLTSDDRIRLWDAEAGAMTSTLTTLQPTQCMTMSPTGDRFALTHADTVGVWDASFLKENILLINEVQGDKVHALAFSPDGRRFASISESDCRTPLQGHKNTVTSMDFKPEGDFIVSGSEDATIIIWDALLVEEVFTLRGHEKAIVSVAFSTDGIQIISGSGDDAVRLWSLRTCAETHPPPRGHAEIQSVAFHPDEEQVISGCLKGPFAAWDVQSDAQLFKLQLVSLPNVLRSVGFSPKGLLMISYHLIDIGQAPRKLVCPTPTIRETRAIMPIVVTPDGWIHDFKTRSLIGKRPSMVSIPLYSSSPCSIAFTPRDRRSTASIMHFPPSKLTKPWTSPLALYYSAEETKHGK
jgi:WD40 repeat protein